MTREDEAKVKEMLAALLADGVSLSDAQNEINKALGVQLTFMDIRIIASTLDVDWKKGDPHPVKTAEEKAEEAEAAETAEPQETAGKTVVEISKLVRPGMALSGSVKFASGSSADWYLDRTGRLGLENLVGEKPTQDDIQLFQMELERAISGNR
ncbi:MAG: hypothetical protein IKC77_06925 [Lentisphaeria bacterium]|nr:hypothetical protein [Lentisphaeria bacterium]